MTFSWDAWVAMTREIPREHMTDALNAVINRKRALDNEEALAAETIDKAAAWQARTVAQLEALAPDRITDGVPPWIAPTEEFDAYPPNARVRHNGEVWVAVSDRVVCGEPGVAPEWVPATEFDAPPPDPDTAAGEYVPAEGVPGE